MPLFVVARKYLFSIVNTARGKSATEKRGNKKMKIRRENVKVASFLLILSVLTSVMPAAAGSGNKDIVDTAVAAGTFHTLATALQAAGRLTP
jgi:hypothetical protein